jgi:3',5'-cyclic AMP phosphodiesterase CpdA
LGRFRLVVLADSHFHPPGVPEQAAWEADRWFNDRNRAAVALVRSMEPALVLHLGDVPHPVPGLSAHAAALDVAAETYRGLPLFVVPGNHDIGDKPHKLSPVPRRHEGVLEDFVARWGPPHQRLEHEGWVFLLINTPVLNSGHPWEGEQWAWLERQVAELSGRPWMAFLHYPPYLCRPDEPEHYDNLAEPARGRLLGLLASARLVFCGHVHHPFWHPRGRQDLWICPSTAFVRPGYSELARIEPAGAFGRDDVDKLGFFVVHVDGEGVELELVRT